MKGRHQVGLRQFIAALPCGTRHPFWNDDRSERVLKKDLPSWVEWKAAMNRRTPNGKSPAKEVSFGGAKGDIRMRASEQGFET